jgi:Protein of unknown function (DUF2934)
MERELSERIRERAYEMWLANGCREGGAEQDWLFAEREVLSARTLGNSPVVAEIVADSLTTKYRKSGLVCEEGPQVHPTRRAKRDKKAAGRAKSVQPPQ